MSEIIPATTNAPAGFLPRQDEYRQVTDLATRLAGTEFVPSALRGKPASVLAAMLVGREVGIGPMHALRAIHIIEGKPTLSAELLMALVLRSGHDLYVAESTRDRCEVRFRRNEWPADRPDGSVVWTVEDAEDAGLTGRGPWQKYRRAMLRSRAVSEAARQGFPDVVEGMGYTAEEMGAEDEDVVVESISPDQSDLDELELRRELHRRAAAAHKAIKVADEELAGNAWASASAGLGENPWTNAEVALLTDRVEELERLAADAGSDVVDAEVIDTPDEDDEDEAGEPAPDPEPEPDDDGDQADPEPEDEPADEEEEPAAIDEYEAELAPEALEDDYDEPLDEEHPGGATRLELLEAYYGRLNVGDVSTLVRTGEVDVTVDGSEVTLELPPGVDGIRLLGALESATGETYRKTVKATLESALEKLGVHRSEWVPILAGRQTPQDAPGDETPPSGPNPTDEGDDAPEEAAVRAEPAPLPEGDDLDARRELLRRWKAAHRELSQVDEDRARRSLSVRLNLGLGPDEAWAKGSIDNLREAVSGIERVRASVLPF